jgi:hypothetical protein
VNEDWGTRLVLIEADVAKTGGIGVPKTLDIGHEWMETGCT